MTERETTRLIAWSNELRITQHSLAGGEPKQAAATPELLLFCHGFCAALDGHHRGEDRTLFPAVGAAYPELRPVLRSLEQDHSMIARLLSELRSAVDRAAPPHELSRHLEGVAAIMERTTSDTRSDSLQPVQTLPVGVPLGGDDASGEGIEDVGVGAVENRIVGHVGLLADLHARQAICVPAADDVLIATAAQLILALANEQPIAQADLVAHAAIDDDAADYLTHIADWPTRVQAVELARELSERSVATRLT